MDATSPSPDDEDMDGLHNLIADKSENLRQVQKVRKTLQHRHEQRRLVREHHNTGIRHTSTGTRVKKGDLVLVKEANSALHNDCVHVNLTHDRWTGPWTVTAGDNTRTVLPRHPPGETGESAASSSFPHQALSSEAPITASRLW